MKCKKFLAAFMSCSMTASLLFSIMATPASAIDTPKYRSGQVKTFGVEWTFSKSADRVEIPFSYPTGIEMTVESGSVYHNVPSMDDTDWHIQTTQSGKKIIIENNFSTGDLIEVNFTAKVKSGYSANLLANVTNPIGSPHITYNGATVIPYGSPTYFLFGDLNNDSQITTEDYNILNKNYENYYGVFTYQQNMAADVAWENCYNGGRMFKLNVTDLNYLIYYIMGTSINGKVVNQLPVKLS